MHPLNKPTPQTQNRSLSAECSKGRGSSSRLQRRHGQESHPDSILETAPLSQQRRSCCYSPNRRTETVETAKALFGSNRRWSRVSIATACCLLLLLAASAIPFANGSECELPQEWHGEWFQSGTSHLGPIVISRHNFSSTVKCIEKSKKKGQSNKYLAQEETVIDDEKYFCFKCMVVSMKHPNVIQYKESYCDPDVRDLDKLCKLITGDAMLYTMFRQDAPAVPCPFGGPLTFTYSKNLQECAHPVSQVDSCADASRLLLRYQACADVPGSESFEEELVCLGSWREGVNDHLVGKINNTHAKSDNDRYRCFIYEKKPHPDLADGTIMYLAQSADATCQGLISANEGGKTMKLTKANQGSNNCRFPSWFTNHLHWHTLDYSQSYLVYPNKTSLSISNGTSAPSDPGVRSHTDLRLVCHEYLKDERSNRHHRKQQPRHGGTHDWTNRRDHQWNSNKQQQWEDGHQESFSPSREHWNRNEASHGAAYGSDYESEENRYEQTDDQIPKEMEEHDRAAAVQHKRGHQRRHGATIIVHVTVGCRTGYWCMRIHKRAEHVVQVETGELAYTAEEACTSHYWNPGNSALTTLIARGEHSRSCGPLGRYRVHTGGQRPLPHVENPECNASNMPSYSHLNVGCTAHDTLELQTSCPVNDVTTYQCHGMWDTEGITYVVASPTSRPSGAPRRVCFAYEALVRDGQASEGGTVTLTARHDTCSSLTHNAHIKLNATLTGPCAKASSIASNASNQHSSAINSLLLLIVDVFRMISFFRS